jgi:hypothetical protein
MGSSQWRWEGLHINSYWYLGLGVLSLILLFYVFIKTKSVRSLFLFLSMVGFGFVIEAVIYNFLHSYQYYPKFIKTDSFYDSNMGAIASNVFALPVVATFIATFRKNWIWILFFVSLFACIEWLFLKLNIYSHYWWQIGFTSIGLPFYFYMAKLLYQKILLPLNGITHSFVLFLILGPISGILHISPIMLIGSRHYLPGWFSDPAEDTTAFAAIFYLCACLFYVIVAKLKWKFEWMKYVFAALCMWLANFILKKVGILHSYVWWDLWYYILISIVILKLAIVISKQLSIGPISKGARHLPGN